jgi:hypothetical protein
MAGLRTVDFGMAAPGRHPSGPHAPKRGAGGPPGGSPPSHAG